MSVKYDKEFAFVNCPIFIFSFDTTPSDKLVLSVKIDLSLINFRQNLRDIRAFFVEYSDFGHAFTENMKILSIRQCKWSDSLVVS